MSLGIGAMLHQLSGGSDNSADKYYGRKITAAKMDSEKNKFFLTFDDGVKIAIWDDGQSCCEHRYMSTDDDTDFLVGKILTDISVRYAENPDENYGAHEQAFVQVTVNDGSVTFVNHNEHNGYYGGFGLTITEEHPPLTSEE